LNGQNIRLARRPSAKLYLWTGQLPVTSLDAVSDEAAVLLSGEELGRQQGPSGDISLDMTGFAAAYAKLKVCARETARVRSTWAATGLPPLSNLQSAPRASAMPALRSNPLAIGASRLEVDATLGAPTKTIGTTALYGYGSSDGEHKIIAAYFDRSGHLQRFARYALKDGKVFDEIGQTELTERQELVAVRDLLATPNIGAGSGQPAALPGWSPDLTGTPAIRDGESASFPTFTPPSSLRPE
jgi:hypothetical protein